MDKVAKFQQALADYVEAVELEKQAIHVGRLPLARLIASGMRSIPLAKDVGFIGGVGGAATGAGEYFLGGDEMNDIGLIGNIGRRAAQGGALGLAIGSGLSMGRDAYRAHGRARKVRAAAQAVES